MTIFYSLTYYSDNGTEVHSPVNKALKKGVASQKILKF